ncbi:hypothetical protein ACH5RR_013187 [Cinchona calisaya]|uniref:Integrase catalytic domain-containing protein n=1 Tax=Cinchona calisaya TaxID=153742 RepID=A0ABD3A2M2_9GENT
MVVKGADETKLWHLRYGHLNIKGLKLLQQIEMVCGLPKLGSLNLCESRIYGKQSKKPFPVGNSWRAACNHELILADLYGPIKTESYGGSRYFMLLTDDYSHMSWVYFLQKKSEAFEAFKKFKSLLETQSGKHVKALRTNRGGEVTPQEFYSFFDEHGIRRELTAPYTPEKNGVAERKNRTVVEMARSMLQEKGLRNQFWREAIATQCMC